MSDKIKCVLRCKVPNTNPSSSLRVLTKEFEFEASTDHDALNVLKAAKEIVKECKDDDIKVVGVFEQERTISS